MRFGSFRHACIAAALAAGTVLAAPAYAADNNDAGARIYAANCAACHQAGGGGLSGAFPPLAGHFPALVTQPGGRAYVISAVVFGMQGQISVDSTSFNGAMPAWSQLSDADLAAVLNYVSHAWDNDKTLPAGFAPFSASEIGAIRAKPLKAEEVHALRPGAAAVAGSTDSAGSGAAPAAITAVSFTADQAAHGKTLYNKTCVDCHGSTLDNGEFGGPPLKGDYFKNHWGAGSVAALFAFTKAKMPTDRPGSLGDQSYADIIAYLLDANGYPSSDKKLPVDPVAQQAMSLKRTP